MLMLQEICNRKISGSGFGGAIPIENKPDKKIYIDEFNGKIVMSIHEQLEEGIDIMSIKLTFDQFDKLRNFQGCKGTGSKLEKIKEYEQEIQKNKDSLEDIEFFKRAERAIKSHKRSIAELKNPLLKSRGTNRMLKRAVMEDYFAKMLEELYAYDVN